MPSSAIPRCNGTGRRARGIRPELRIDDALSGPDAFNLDKAGVAHSGTQETAAVDFILPF